MIIFRDGIFNQYRRLIIWIQRFLDSLLVILLLLLSCSFYGQPLQKQYYILAGITFLLVSIVFQATNLYRPWRGRRIVQLVTRVFLAWALVVLILSALGFVLKISSNFSRGVLLPWVTLSPVGLLALRLLVYFGLNWARARGRNSRTAVIGGAGELGRQLAKKIINSNWLGIRLLGFFDDRRAGQEIKIGEKTEGIAVLGNLEDMVVFTKTHKVDMVYLALPLKTQNRLNQVVDALQDTTASVYFIPDIFTFSLIRASLSDLSGIPLISLWETPFYGLDGWVKRAEDVIISSLIILISWPLMLVIALGVRLSSAGPVIFKQRRYGLNGKEILVYKFRSMKVWDDGPVTPMALKNDPRVTRFGALLRRTSLDELPQFINVLNGTMSIVGPRPHAVAHNELYRKKIPNYMLRHKVKPGITGWAQVNGCRGEIDTIKKLEERIQYDLDYLRLWSIWFDLRIIFQTIFMVLFIDKNAY
jgi:putative colanic acid biosysnthesis UDP-glucose lipid carrier transferase